MRKKRFYTVSINENGEIYMWGPYKYRKALKIMDFFADKYPDDHHDISDATSGDPRIDNTEEESG